MQQRTLVRLGGVALAAGGVAGLPAVARAAVEGEVAFVLTSFSLLMQGALVMWMAAGFCMLEAGLVRSRNTALQLLKNLAIYAIAGLMFWALGYNLMHAGVNQGVLAGFIGQGGPWAASDPGAVRAGFVPLPGQTMASGAHWFFQMVFVATSASIVSGTVAERVRLWPFLAFTAVLTAVLYPIAGSWSWGGGWLKDMGFLDFAGGTVVHSAGGWAALAGALMLGPRKGKYGTDGRVHPIPGANLPLATLGTLILWLGWFGFNGGSYLHLGSATDATALAAIYINTNLAACAGVVVAMVLTQVLYRKVDLTLALNGALGGLVAITAEPLAPSPAWAVGVGAIGGLLVVLAVPFFDKLKIDDVVGALPVHLVCGIWGTLAVPLSNPDGAFGAQLLGMIAVGGFMFTASLLVWGALKATTGIRVRPEEEDIGLDRVELGMEAYPEFGRGSGKL